MEEYEYEVKFYENGEEIEIDEVLDEYLNGIIEACRNEIASRGKYMKVWRIRYEYEALWQTSWKV